MTKIGQGEVLTYLEKQKEPMARGEIAKAMKVHPRIVSRDLRILLKYGEIKCIEINRFEAQKRFGCPRRMLLYYV